VPEVRVEQRLDIAPQHRRTHDHRIAAGKEDAGDLGVLPEVGRDPGHVVGGHLEIRLIHELGPPEAVGAVSVAGLSLFGEHKHRFRIFVLDSGQWLIGQLRDVEGELARGMRVEPGPHGVRGRAYLGPRGLPGQQASDLAHVLGREHVGLREDQPVDRVVRRRIPVDEVVDDVLVGAERKHRGHRPDRQPFAGVQPRARGQSVQVLGCVSAITAAR
jgi:hypothetical protein